MVYFLGKGRLLQNIGILVSIGMLTYFLVGTVILAKWTTKRGFVKMVNAAEYRRL